VVLVFYGKAVNKKLAQAWHEKALDLIKSNFAGFGMGEAKDPSELE